MKKRTLGNSGLEVSAFGLGCMSMTSVYGPAADKSEMIRLIRPLTTRASPFSTLPRPMGLSPTRN